MRVMSQSPDPLARMHTMTKRQGKPGIIDVKALLAGDEEFRWGLKPTCNSTNTRSALLCLDRDMDLGGPCRDQAIRRVASIAHPFARCCSLLSTAFLGSPG